MLSLPPNVGPAPFVVSINMIASLIPVALTTHSSAWASNDMPRTKNGAPTPFRVLFNMKVYHADECSQGALLLGWPADLPQTQLPGPL